MENLTAYFTQYKYFYLIIDKTTLVVDFDHNATNLITLLHLKNKVILVLRTKYAVRFVKYS